MAIQTLTILKILVHIVQTKMLKITFDDNYKNEDKRCNWHITLKFESSILICNPEMTRNKKK